MNYSQYIFSLIICFLLSLFIGIERQYRRRSVGLRTTVLVAIGSYLFVSFSFLLFGNDMDITRIASQVVTGVGFLGAGVILKDGMKIRGLTTAATLWCTSSIGILCAGGFIKEAIAGTIIILFSNIILRYINKIINIKTQEKSTQETYHVKISIGKDKRKKVIDSIQNNKLNFKIDNLCIIKNNVNFDINTTKNGGNKLGLYISKLADDYNIEEYSYEKTKEEVINEIFEL